MSTQNRPFNGLKIVFATQFFYTILSMMMPQSPVNHQLALDQTSTQNIYRNLPRGMGSKGNVLHIRKRVPAGLKTVIGKSEIIHYIAKCDPQSYAAFIHRGTLRFAGTGWTDGFLGVRIYAEPGDPYMKLLLASLLLGRSAPSSTCSTIAGNPIEPATNFVLLIAASVPRWLAAKEGIYR